MGERNWGLREEGCDFSLPPSQSQKEAGVVPRAERASVLEVFARVVGDEDGTISVNPSKSSEGSSEGDFYDSLSRLIDKQD